jgi:hypothetical protein
MESTNIAIETAYFIFGIKLSGYDMLLVIMCPICAMLGTLVSNAVKGILEKPEFEPLKELPPQYQAKFEAADSVEADKQRFLSELNHDTEQWHQRKVRRSEVMDSIRLPFIGLVLGFVIALYFLGAITNDLTSLARVLALCVLLGYQAPNIWFTQEKAIKKSLDKKVDSFLGEHGLTSSSKGRS